MDRLIKNDIMQGVVDILRASSVLTWLVSLMVNSEAISLIDLFQSIALASRRGWGWPRGRWAAHHGLLNRSCVALCTKNRYGSIYL